MFVKIITPLILAGLLQTCVCAQQTASVATKGKAITDEAAAWKAIDGRDTPQWWKDAKFGIFIHWGPYSVPAFSEVGRYSEWYWEDLMNPKRRSHKAVKAFHEKNYGKDFKYEEFADQFKCELFDPAQWAEAFEESGAKYVVLTSKHHDGYCLWPNEQADKSFGRPWCSTNSGPMRDLVGELTEEVRKTDVKMGLYFSIYEWYNPLYKTKLNSFVDDHLIPQFKDVVNKYEPAVIFSDGEWDHPAADWKSAEMLTWLFNESPCKDEVVINDRWGKGDRHKHGGYYTTEYGAGLPDGTNAWEENRGMAHSFGYSRTERFEDYNSSESLILMLADIVSRGGNFLLDIGPTADGRIPPLMEERLSEIGDWLDVNGEAIYGTTTHSSTCQWSTGKAQELGRGNYRVKYDVEKLMKSPEEGMARKELLFTRKGETLYAICALLPDETMTLHHVQAAEGATVSMLGVGELEWEQSGEDLIIKMPKLNPSKMPCEHAWTFKVSKIQLHDAS
ncbi:alpha-L-fucosidase [Neorhodopirellula lusitana]|uniref:alpha-L-fucosidase n=1 Tax=Neorhodopirellula lusitana TaxID=445327 RepID=A0ABY1PVV5_9BACT|nr:alpha-L-fucosidase [Neorhodopirellula lusitana]SMP50541.1 alpha-L-fucosidase [Neorhodopirellula lusitana]